MENVWNVVVLLLVVGVVFVALQPRYEFSIKIRRGIPTLSRGRVSGEFLQNVSEVCDRHGVRDGWIAGVRQGKRTSLLFSSSLPKACQQQLRNLWTNRFAM